MKSLLLIPILLLLAFPMDAQLRRNLVFEGGGIRGIAYAGAVEVLEQKNITDSVEQIAGTSVGAIVASLLAVNHKADEVKRILYDLKVQHFNDGKFIFIGGMNRFVKRYGWYRGNALENWVGNLLKEKTGTEDLSFAELHRLHVKDKRYKDLFITATNLSKQKSTVFSWQTYPDMKIKTAVRASLSIPLYYSAVRLDEQGNKITDKKQKHDVFVDGGILANYPLSLFDKNGIPDTATLGMKLERPEQLKTTNEEIAPYEIVHFKSYVGALYNLILETLNRDSTIKHESFRTIYISTGGISPKVRKITKRQKDLLYKSGVEGATEFFQRRLSSNDTPYKDE